MTQVIKKINDKLDFNYLENSDLSIQVNLDGFSFCILNNHLKEITALCTYAFFEKTNNLNELLKNIQQITDDEPLLRQSYRSVNITFKNNLNTFVPLDLFEEELASSYLQHTIKVLSNDFVTHDLIKPFNLVNVYIPYVNITNFFFDLYGSFEYQHASSVLVKKLLEINQHTAEKVVYVNVSKTDFDIVVLEQQRLIFYNSFPLRTVEDFAYFILFTFEQLQLDRESVKVIVLGLIDESDELFKIIYKYIRTIEFLDYEYPFKSDLLLNIPKHQNVVVLNQFK